MAQFHDGGGRNAQTRSASDRSRSRSHVDMTAMVDVAFLLLTFFVLSAVVSKDYVVKLAVPPDNPGPAPQILEERVMTIAVGANDSLWYYTGVSAPEVHMASTQGNAFRHALMQHIRQVEKPYFLIKPLHAAAYGSVLDVFDEMLILSADTYALAPFTEADSLLIFQNIHP